MKAKLPFGTALVALVVGVLPFVAPAQEVDADALDVAAADSEAVVEVDPSIAVDLDLAVLLDGRTTLHPVLLSQIGLGPEIDELLAAAQEAEDRRAEAVRRHDEAEAERSRLTAQRNELRRQLRVARDEHADRVEEFEAALADLRVYAVDAYVAGDEAALERPAPGDARTPRRPTLTQAVGNEVVGIHDAARQARDDAADLVGGLEAELEGVGIALDILQSRLLLAEEDRAAAVVEIGELADRTAVSLALRTVPGVGLPLVVVDAYYSAAERTAEAYPACGIDWWHLAGIGKVESGHGTFGGSSVDPAGNTSGTILGPVLDGDPWLAIPDTDGGVLDGDIVWDRAVGPMQFIPGSWGIFGGDGNGDGVADPHNLYDAARAAGNHLCRAHTGLGDEANLRASLLGYNRSEVYGSQVIAIGRSYQEALGLTLP